MAKVQINYKSGISVDFECESFAVSRHTNDTLEVEWSSKNLPRPLLIGVGEIESVWEL